MKKIACTIACFMLLSGTAFAHPPSAITLTANGTAVDIIVKHTTNDPAKHYIGSIAVTVNGVKTIAETYTAQTDRNAQEVVYQIPSLKKGDTVEVGATCNKGGNLVKKFTI